MTTFSSIPELTEEDYGTKWMYYALAMRVLCVAVRGQVKDWAAYIVTVPGHSHLKEASLAISEGEKLPHWIAKGLFPAFEKKYTWRE